MSVVVMARVPRRGEVRRALEPEIGVGACLALHAALLLRTVAWARRAADGDVYVAYEPADGAGELRQLLGDEVHLFPQNGEGISGRVADAVARVYARASAPILLVWPDLPALTDGHAYAAFGDLDAGADAVFGPVFDGGFYLVGVQRPLGSLFSLPESAWRGPDATTQVLQAVAAGGLEVGLLKAERALHRPADVRAVLADPTLPKDIARALGRR